MMTQADNVDDKVGPIWIIISAFNR